MTVNTVVMEKWATALESGNYKQVNGKLTDGEGGFCCLGVLCEIAVDEGVIEPKSIYACSCGDNHGDEPEWQYDGAFLTPSRTVAEWAFGVDNDGNPELDTGLDVPRVEDDYPYIEHDGPYKFEAATSLNDTYKWTFEEIAAAIRRTYLEGNESGSSSDSGQVPAVAAT